jgi:hypothetical protein
MISKSLIAKEAAKRGTRKALVLDEKFIAQNAFINDTSRFISAQCSRRAGKSNGLAIRFFKTMERHPGSQSIYLALTRESAHDILWQVLIDHDTTYRIGCTFTESKLEMRHPNGATLKLMGADMKNFIKRLKGRKYPGVGIDEAQDFGIHLQSLVDDVLTPAISDYPDGWLAVTGTPGPVPQGYFFDVVHNGKYGYSRHAWTVLENPYMPHAEAFIAQEIERKQWEPNHPTLLREWRNQWVLDVDSLWVRYNESKNHYTNLPPAKYNYLMGIDLGYNDADALAVIAWSESSPIVYLVEEVLTKKQGLTELVAQIQHLARKYDVAKMIIDEGGLGKKLAEEMRRQHKIPVHAAEKQRKQETVEFLNDALRTGRFMAPKTSRFVQDSYLVQIDWDKSTPDRIVVKKQPHSDIIDAVLYAFKESPAYAYEAPVKRAEKGSEAWFKEETDMMERAAEEHFKQQEEDEYANSTQYEGF